MVLINKFQILVFIALERAPRRLSHLEGSQSCQNAILDAFNRKMTFLLCDNKEIGTYLSQGTLAVRQIKWSRKIQQTKSHIQNSVSCHAAGHVVPSVFAERAHSILGLASFLVPSSSYSSSSRQSREQGSSPCE